MREPPSTDNNFLEQHVALLSSSYRRWLGVDLWRREVASADQVPELLFTAPFVVVSHDTAADPIFNYGNLIAMQLFECSWEEFTSLPSRRSAEPVNREERARLLAAVTEKNFIDDYAGVRISAKGKRFYIPRATVWNVVDADGTYRGQAATFSSWDFI